MAARVDGLGGSQQKEVEQEAEQAVGQKRDREGEGDVATLGHGHSVLLLGEGQFSFALAWRRRFPGCTLLATSLDTEKEVLDKYSDAARVLASLRRTPRTEVQHGVNALSRLAEQLEHREFDHVIFNFPHVGREDVWLHRAFVSHLLDELRCVARAYVHITLAQQQPEDWQLARRAEDLGYTVAGVYEFQAAAFPGYEQKRHQVGRSFRGRVASARTFSLLAPRASSGMSLSSSATADTRPPNLYHSALSTNVVNDGEKAVRVFVQKAGHGIDNGDDNGNGNGDHGAGAEQETLPKRELDETRRAESTPPGVKRRRKKKSKAEEFVPLVLCSTRANDSGEFDCPSCPGRAFASAVALQSHIYNAHVVTLPHDARKDAIAAIQQGCATQSSTTCPECGQVCANEEGLLQHRRAKHDQQSLLGPTTSKGGHDHTGEPPLATDELQLRGQACCRVCRVILNPGELTATPPSSCSSAAAACAANAANAATSVAPAGRVAAYEDDDDGNEDGGVAGGGDGDCGAAGGDAGVHKLDMHRQRVGDALGRGRASWLQLHMQSLMPCPVIRSEECPNCGRVFANHRAVTQHWRSCASSR